jgi:putative polyhydroxyalkanoate system protein
MATIHIKRPHHLGLSAARKIAFKWAEEVEKEFTMQCSYEEGDHKDCVAFERSGVKGDLTVTATEFELKAELGFLLGAFKSRIEKEIIDNLDNLLAKKAGKPAAKADGKPAAKSPAKATPKP